MVLLDKSAPGLLLIIEVVEEDVRICTSLTSLRHYICGEFLPEVVLEVRTQSQDDTICELRFASAVCKISESVVYDTDFSRFNCQMLLALKDPLKSRREDVLHPQI